MRKQIKKENSVSKLLIPKYPIDFAPSGLCEETEDFTQKIQ